MNKQATVISLANQKGGVTKTTTTAALLEGLANEGYKVLGIDFDAQGNLSTYMGADKTKPTMREVLTKKYTAWEVVQVCRNCDIIPANIYLAQTENEVSNVGKDSKLKEAIKPLLSQYDFIVIDTPPALGFLTINAFVASKEIIIASTPARYSLDGLVTLHETVEEIKEVYNPDLKIVGVLVSRLRAHTRVGKELKELTKEVGNHIGTMVFDTTIRETIGMEDALCDGASIYTYSRNKQAAQDYQKFVWEYLIKSGHKTEKDLQFLRIDGELIQSERGVVNE